MSKWRLLLIFLCILSFGCEDVVYRDGYGPDGQLPDTSSPPRDINGTWTDIAGDGSATTIVLVQSDNEITGTLSDEEGRTGTITGTIYGDRLEVTYTYSDGHVIYNAAIVDDNGMSGTFWSADGSRNGTWSATRVAATEEEEASENALPDPSIIPAAPVPQPEPDPPQTPSTIVYSGLKDIIVGISPLSDWFSRPFDVNGDAITDFDFDSRHLTLAFSPKNANASITDPVMGMMPPLGEGTLIGDTLIVPAEWSSSSQQIMVSCMELLGNDIGCAGPWTGATNGYIGMAFDIDGSTHYGWARMTIRGAARADLHDWAYETRPGIGIAAGATE